MHDHDYDHGIRARTTHIRAALDREATRLEELRRRCAQRHAERSAGSALLARLRVDRVGRCCREDASPV